MSPSELSWFQGCLFLFLGVAGGVAGGYGLNRCQNRRTNHGTSDVELGSIVVDNGSTPPPSDDADSSGADEEAWSPSNLLNPVGEAMASTGAPRCPDRSRFRSKSRRRSRRLLQPSAKTRQKSHFLEFVAKTAAPNFARRETAYSSTVGDRISSPMSPPTDGLLPLSGGVDEALPPSHHVREVLALPGTLSCPDRKRRQSDSCRRMNAPDKRTKCPFENFMARNVGRPEPANMVIADSSSTSMASKTAVLRRPPRRHFVPRPSREVPLVDHVQARTSDGLRFRQRVSQGETLNTPHRAILGPDNSLRGRLVRPAKSSAQGGGYPAGIGVFFKKLRLIKPQHRVIAGSLHSSMSVLAHYPHLLSLIRRLLFTDTNDTEFHCKEKLLRSLELSPRLAVESGKEEKRFCELKLLQVYCLPDFSYVN